MVENKIFGHLFLQHFAGLPDETIEGMIQVLLLVKSSRTSIDFVPSEKSKIPLYVAERLKEISREQELMNMRLREVLEYIDLEDEKK